MKLLKSFIFSFSTLIIIFTSLNVSFAATSSNQKLNRFIKITAKKYGFSQSYIRSILSHAHFNRKVIVKMEHPYEAKPWYEYKKLFVTPERVKEGIQYWDKSNKLVAWEEKEYRVPGNIILAIIGIETKYGRKMGTFNELDTLDTLAFHYPSRSRFFQAQLGAYIALTKAYKINPYTTLGSYAGAMGQCQFMPSSYLHYAVDFHGKGRPNLFSDKADVIFSLGNYLRQKGWETNQPVAIPAKITGTSYQKVLKDAHHLPKEPKLTLAQLARYGIVPASGYFNSTLRANLIKLQGDHGPEYWLTFHNFYVITRYNPSDLYAMAAFQLAVKLQNAWDKKQES